VQKQLARVRALSNGDYASSPAVVNCIIYAGSYDGSMYAINAATGHQIWRFPSAGPIQSSPAVIGNVVYFGTTSSRVNSERNVTEGAKTWTVHSIENVTEGSAASSFLIGS
jgi:outer membrane protein assembly factor BamB